MNQPEPYKAIPSDELLTFAQVSAKLQFGRTAIYRMIKRDGFPPPIKFGVLSRWSRIAVDTWIDARARAGQR